MSPRRPTLHRLGRQRREVAFAVACAAAVVLVTAVLLWVLAPSTDEPAPSSPPISLPSNGSGVPVPSTVVPDPSVPATATPDTAIPSAGDTSTTLAGG